MTHLVKTAFLIFTALGVGGALIVFVVLWREWLEQRRRMREAARETAEPPSHANYQARVAAARLKDAQAGDAKGGAEPR